MPNVLVSLGSLVLQRNGAQLKGTVGICIKLTGDGTQIATGLTIINVDFTVLEEGNEATSVIGNYSVAIFKMAEN